MIRVHLDGELREVREGDALSTLIPGQPAGCAVAIIRPATQEQEKTASITVTTTAGEITLELAGHEVDVLERPEAEKSLVSPLDRPVRRRIRAVSLRGQAGAQTSPL